MSRDHDVSILTIENERFLPVHLHLIPGHATGATISHSRTDHDYRVSLAVQKLQPCRELSKL